MPVKMPWLNSILLAPFSLSLLTLGSIIENQRDDEIRARDKKS